MDLIKDILPAIITILGNIGFYFLIKVRIEKSIEKHKISFSGIFKERVDIYRKLLKKLYAISFDIQQYQYTGAPELGKKLMMGINAFINFYLVNQPFLSDKMISKLKTIHTEYQSIFDDFYKHHSIIQNKELDHETRMNSYKNYFEAVNKLRGGGFKELEDIIVSEMRTDLRVDNL